MTHTADAYVANLNILVLPCAYAGAYACAYLTTENHAALLLERRQLLGNQLITIAKPFLSRSFLGGPDNGILILS